MNRRTTLAAALALTAALALAGCGSQDADGVKDAKDSKGGAPQLKVSGAYMPQPVTQEMAGAFMTVRNSGGTADKLTSVTSDISKDITIHETVGTKMQQVDALDVPADGQLELARGGNHLMFMGLKRKPVKGDKVTVELHFEKSGPVKVDVPVEASTFVPKKK
ncbi:copper chaperone PCu(A)C [Streptomyces sp. MST-110588]|uniref:copper chaperone PCu(A)C n=1 Tax=Streptomyces sp. MST-110588 TaxID=2833628 RepID=UPI001F5D066A|nr:copper chaperone PCu(A)C [Streptomyces sp. MST-110588]UNO40871.1 copper chaperone PCu(A)C [Streptomyces sp. MST-110588]